MKKLLSFLLALTMLLGCMPLSAWAAQAGEEELPPAEIYVETPEETAEPLPEEPEPAGTEPAETEPAETEPAETEPAETEPPETEPAETEPSETAPAEPVPGETEPLELEPEEPENSGLLPEEIPVSLRFVCSPEDLVLTVRKDGEEILPDPEDRTLYHLLPGSYTYGAVCEGYLPLEETELTVEAGGEPMEVTLSLKRAGTSLRPEPIEYPMPQSSMDGQELLNGYLETLFYRGSVSLLSTAGRDSLSEPDRIFYDFVYGQFREIAAGRESSSVFTYSAVFTAEQLGVARVADESIYGDVMVTDEVRSKLDAMFDGQKVFDALMEDCAYETYWIDRNRGWFFTPGWAESVDNQANTVTAVVQMEIPVDPAYALAGSFGDCGSYTLDLTATGAGSVAARAGETARQVVAEHAGLSDLEKLEAYKHYICSQVDYDRKAIENHGRDGSGPWAVIHVFDNDPGTNVVCEGYSRAFKYLCDLSDFQSDITCYQVEGNTSGGLHMWNLVDVDGVQVVCDITAVDQKNREENSAFLAAVTYTSYGYDVGSWLDYQDRDHFPAAAKDRLSAVALTLPEPIAGCAPVTELQGEGFRGEVRWTPAVTDVFENGVAYTAQITLWPSRAPFRDHLRVTVNGKPAAFGAGTAGFTRTGTCEYVAEDLTADWIREKGKWKYVHSDGTFTVSDWELIQGDWYHFDGSGYRQTGWIQDGGLRYYLDRDGTMVTGLLKIGRDQYYFDSQGAMQTGWVRTHLGWRHFKDNGAMAVNAWAEDGDLRYYVDRNGGCTVGPAKIGKYQYYFDDQGVMQTGWQNVNEQMRYYGPDGAMVLNGWAEQDGFPCYLDSKGNLRTGLQKIGREQYYFDENGHMLTGWQSVKEKNLYFCEPSGELAVNRLATIEGKTYYLDRNCIPATGLKKVGKAQYYFDSQGVMQTGWQTVNGRRLYFRETGELVLGDWVTIDGSRYYMDRKGSPSVGLVKVGKAQYYFDSQGVMQTGWHVIRGSRMYFRETGELAVNGFQKIGGETYYADRTGKVATGFVKVGKDFYFFDGLGAMQTGWQNPGDGERFFTPEGPMLANTWADIGNAIYYLDRSGKVSTGFVRIRGAVFYFDETGRQQFGWQVINGDTYYFEEEYGIMWTGWLNLGETYYYFDKTGVMAENCWVDGFYLDSTGCMLGYSEPGAPRKLANFVKKNGDYIRQDGVYIWGLEDQFQDGTPVYGSILYSPRQNSMCFHFMVETDSAIATTFFFYDMNTRASTGYVNFEFYTSDNYNDPKVIGYAPFDSFTYDYGRTLDFTYTRGNPNPADWDSFCDQTVAYGVSFWDYLCGYAGLTLNDLGFFALS